MKKIGTSTPAAAPAPGRATQPAAPAAGSAPQRPVREASFLQSRVLSYLLPLLVLCAALGVAHHFWDKERREIETALQAEFDTRVRETVGIFKERMLAYEQALRATHGLFATSNDVQRGDFQAFVANLRLERHPGLQGMGYALYIAPEQRDKHVATIRSQGFPAYMIRRAGQSEAVTSAIFFEPSGSTFLSTLGSDYFAEPSRRPAMAAARDSGGIAISNKVKLPEEDAVVAQTGYRMVLPVYKNGKPHETVEERRANIAGWIYAAFSMDGLMSNILGERANIVVEVYDGGGEEGDDRLIDTYSDRVGGETAVKLFYTSKRVDVGGYSWTVTARSLPNFATPIAISKLQLVARLGVVASVLLALAAWLLLRKRLSVLREGEHLRVARDHAEAASHAKTQFLAAASHDLRQPIQALGLFVATLQAMARRSQLAGSDLAPVARSMRLALDGLGGLLNGLFDLSRLDSGTVSVIQRKIAVADLLAEIQNTFAGPAQEKQLRLKVVMPHDLWIDTDPAMLSRVLSNLATNALRYTERGSILVGCRRRPGQVEIQVIDTGIGIAPDEQAKVFGEFYQVPDVARIREQGMGLGLAIVQRTVALLGGEVRLSSTPGKGSVFSVLLPRAAAPEKAEAAVAVPEVRTAAHVGRPAGTVMVIDDDPVIRASMQALLTQWGYPVLLAASLEEAVDAAMTGPHADAIMLLVSDYQLAENVNGIDAILAVTAALGRPVPALIITGDTSAGPRETAAQHGVEILYKPIAPDALHAVVQRVALPPS